MRYNLKAKISRQIFNHAGEKAWKLTPAMELYTAVATAGLSDKFYESAAGGITRIRELIRRNDPAFVARLAVYAREQMHLRSIPIVLAVELAYTHSGDHLVSKLIHRVVQRADEITALLSCYAQANERYGVKKLNRLSKQVQKGLVGAFNKFDEYQFAKYNRKTAVTFRDALFLVHPKAKDDVQQTIFDKIVKDELETPYTWEVELSAIGRQEFASEDGKQAAIRTKWEELIYSGRLGYMALLRNLRNILQAGVGAEAINKVCTTLADARAVANSRQLPFRFLSAYREVKEIESGYAGQLLDALEAAVLESAQNIAGYDAATKVV